MRLPGSIPSALALGLFASFLAVALPAALDRSQKLVEQAIEHSGETVIEERSRVWGAPYTQRIEEMRSTTGHRSGSASISRRAGRSFCAGGPFTARGSPGNGSPVRLAGWSSPTRRGFRS
jgi:hypothetical protein